MLPLKCCMCERPAIKIMEGFTLCGSHKCYVTAHVPGAILTGIFYFGLTVMGLFLGLVINAN